MELLEQRILADGGGSTENIENIHKAQDAKSKA